MIRFVFIMLWILPFGVWGQVYISPLNPKACDAKIINNRVKSEESAGNCREKRTIIYDRLGRITLLKYEEYKNIRQDKYHYLNDSGSLYCVTHYHTGLDTENIDTFFENRTYDSKHKLILQEIQLKRDLTSEWACSTMFYYSDSNKLDSIIYKHQDTTNNYIRHYYYYEDGTKTETIYMDRSFAHYTFDIGAIIKEVDSGYRITFYNSKYNKDLIWASMSLNYFKNKKLLKKETVHIPGDETTTQTYKYYKNGLIKKEQIWGNHMHRCATKYRYKYYK